MLRFLLLLSAAATLFAAEPGTVIRIRKVDKPPKLEDYLAGRRVNPADTVITDFRQMTPGDGAPVSQETTAYVSYDDRNLYAVVICKDDPALIRARYAKQDQIMTDDRVTIAIDTFHDHHRAYWFDINPYGIQADGNVTDGVEDDPSWDTVWHSEARLLRDGYAVLFAIPFKSVRFPDSDTQTWGFIVGRWIIRNNEFSLWPHISQSRPGWVRQAGDMEGIGEVSPGRNVQLIPYGSFAASRYLDAPNAVFKTQRDPRAGIDVKTVIKDAFTLDATLNPDFSQVESDEPQVTVNQRYEVFFPEKRPFFLENAGFFKTPEMLFHSRRIADPEFGARLTGKVGRWALGFLAADDRAPGKVTLSGDRAAVGVLRLQREFMKDSSAAVMVTSRDFGNTHNRVASLDTRIRVLPNWIVTAQAMTSDTRFANGTRLNGPAYSMDFAHAGRHFISKTTYTDRSPEFRTDLGFINRVDIRELSHTAGYKWKPEGRMIVSFGPQLKALINYDRRGRLQDWSINPEFLLELPRMTQIAVERWEGFELFSGHGFREHHNELTVQSDLLRWMALEAEVEQGAAVNYYPLAGRVPFAADSMNAQAGFTLRPNPRLRLDPTYIYNSLSAGSESVFNNHIARFKANYQFNREFSLRAILDYNAVLPNAALVNLDREKHIGADVLFTYMLNPGTALYAGYTDLFDNLKLDPTLSPAVKRTSFPDLNTGRQFFIKLSYLLRF